jgi:hypothetical protein
VIAGGLVLGATTGPDDGYRLTATWLALVGFGVGPALAPSMDAVLGELPPDDTGAGTALTMTLRQVGGALASRCSKRAGGHVPLALDVGAPAARPRPTPRASRWPAR